MKYTLETKVPIVACRFCQYRRIYNFSYNRIKCVIDDKNRVETSTKRPNDCPLKTEGEQK